MKQGSSSRKVNEQAREVIASILLFEISDPRLNMVTITSCEVSFDRSVANVYYTTEPSRYLDVAAAFEAACGRIRSLYGKETVLAHGSRASFLCSTPVSTRQNASQAHLRAMLQGIHQTKRNKCLPLRRILRCPKLPSALVRSTIL